MVKLVYLLGLCFCCSVYASNLRITNTTTERIRTTSSHPPLIHYNPELINRNSVENLDDYFDWKLLMKVLLKDTSENVIISPFSLKLVLSILMEAAANNTNTLDELKSALSRVKSPIEISEFWNTTLKSFLKESDNYDFKIATRIFADEYIEPTQKYGSQILSVYNATIDNLQFSNSKKTAATINAWSKAATKGNIENLVSEENIENAVMLIINAMYFKGIWEKEFPSNNSAELDFYRQPTEKIKAQYMSHTETFNYLDSSKLHAKILQLPYQGDRFVMTLLLPKAKGGLEELIREMSSSNFKTAIWATDETDVKVTIPKLHFDYSVHLKDTLKAIGINDIFNENASLPLFSRGADLNKKLKVSEIIQKAGLKVDEKGSTAYAATVVGIENKFGGSSVVEEFTANRPFLFFIKDKISDSILFAGKVVDPTFSAQ